MTLDGRLSAAVAQPRFYAALVGSFAALAVFLATLGVYGLLSFTVAQRRGRDCDPDWRSAPAAPTSWRW